MPKIPPIRALMILQKIRSKRVLTKKAVAPQLLDRLYVYPISVAWLARIALPVESVENYVVTRKKQKMFAHYTVPYYFGLC